MFRPGESAEEAFQHELLSCQTTQIAFLIVSPTQETLQLMTFEKLRSGLQINQQPLAVVAVVKAFWHIHFHSAHQITECSNAIEVHKDVMVDRSTHQP